MSTYGEMQERIEDEIDDSTLGSQIQKAIKTAILKYSSRRFWFNEARTLTFNTVAGQEFYTVADSADIPNLLLIDNVIITISGSDKYGLERKTYPDLEALSSNDTSDGGQPSYYAYYAKALRLYPIPDAAYAIRISGVFDLGDLSLTSDTNAWMTDAETLIRSRAKREIYTHVKRDKAAADNFAQAEAEALDDLVEETTKRASTGQIQATTF